MCMNVYDVRLMDDWPACGMNWPPDLTEVYDFLRVSRLFGVLRSGSDILAAPRRHHCAPCH